MNSIPWLALAVLASAQMNAQDISLDSVLDYEIPSHEIRYGALKLAFGGIFEGGYEYVFKPRHGFGTNVLVNFNPKEYGEGYYEDFAINPYYRFYLLKTKNYWGKGLFVEGFLNFYTGRESPSTIEFEGANIVVTHEDRRYFETAIGLAVGQKWVYKSGFVLELKAGVGNSLLGNSDVQANFKGDVSLGYRF
ncbi:hypothetical protein [Flavobacterium sp. HSC-61S13]|uniref:hypothetical protein n=1 Tax=Flavobacterium sp. HSC-61S13 TaxID=2910963 RepID=UPI0020A02341|nr:hypothetical protein [Flavobacterium sp. HSC-61S13]MCP1996122.1 hypothetical protein [Flavobacterium sp. HSC-61S13]